MTRYVDEERTSSGLLKAIGYSNKDISLKFLIYGLLASFLGTTLGIIGGTYLLSALISEILTGALTIGKTHLYSYWFYNGIAYLLAMLSAVLPAYLIVKRNYSSMQLSYCCPNLLVRGQNLVGTPYFCLESPVLYSQGDHT